MALRVLVALAVLAVLGLGSQVPLAGQTRQAAPEAKRAATASRSPSLAPDHQPDLQGVWVNNSATPLERPPALAGRPLLTDEEVAELRKRAARLFTDEKSDFAPGDNVFLAALANVEQFKNPNATGSALDMVEREFDNRTSLIVDPPDGRIPPLTPEATAKQRAAEDAARRPPTRPEDLNNALRCITFGVPRLGEGSARFGSTYGTGPYSYLQIVQAPGYVVITPEAIGDARIIPLDGRPHLSPDIHQWNGDSRGRWATSWGQPITCI